MKVTIESHIAAIKEIFDRSEIYKFSFNLTELPPHDNFELDIRRHGRFKELFEQLNQKKSSCLYWFECESEADANNLIQIFADKRGSLVSNSGKYWRVPPINKVSSKVIYLGVRQGGVRKKDMLSNLSGRIIQHLGYYSNEGTGALHLLQWASNQDCKLTLNVIEIGKPEDVQYLYILEKLVSISLKPFCGKH